jgi:hypothetical protein
MTGRVAEVWTAVTLPSGDGDVRIWPWPEDLDGPVYVELGSPSGWALFAVSRPVLADFVHRCHALVPPGPRAASSTSTPSSTCCCKTT